jgi:hypothetical protein
VITQFGGAPAFRSASPATGAGREDGARHSRRAGVTHTVRYDDGDVEDVDLSVEKYEFVGAPAAAARISEDPPDPAPAPAPAVAARPALTAEQRARAERNKLEAARRRESKELKDKPEVRRPDEPRVRARLGGVS